MSHDDLAAGKARGGERRKVNYVTTLEDLEGRLLLSAARHLMPNRAMLRHVGGAQAGGRARLQTNARAKREAMLQARARSQMQGPRRLQAMNALRMRNPTINIQQSVNVNPTVNVAPATATSTSNASPSTTSNSAPNTSYHDALAAAGVAPSGSAGAATSSPVRSNPPPSRPQAPAPAQSTPKPSNPSTPAQSSPSTPPQSTPGRTPASGLGSSGWTSINNPPVAQQPSTPSNPSTPSQPQTPTGTSPGGSSSSPTTPPADSTPGQPDPGAGGSTTPPATTPSTPVPTFPDGTVLRNEQTGELGLYSGAQRRLISPPVAAKMGLTAAQETAVTANVFKAIPKGDDYFPDGMFVRNGQTGEISQYSGGVFHVVSTPIAAKLGLGADGVATISAAQYAGVNKGLDYFPEGVLLQNQQTGEVDIYQGGQRHWISVDVASKMKLTVDQLTTISPTQFNAIPQGLDYFPDGVYLQNQETGVIAQYSGGQTHLVSAPVASKIGLTASQLIPVSPTQYNAITKGPDYFVEGMFLQNNQTGEVDQYSGGQRHWVSAPVATAINLTAAQITTIGADQFNAVPRGGDYTPPPPAATAPDPAATA